MRKSHFHLIKHCIEAYVIKQLHCGKQQELISRLSIREGGCATDGQVAQIAYDFLLR